MDEKIQSEAQRILNKLHSLKGEAVDPRSFINGAANRFLFRMIFGDEEPDFEFDEAIEKLNEAMRNSSALGKLPVAMFAKYDL